MATNSNSILRTLDDFGSKVGGVVTKVNMRAPPKDERVTFVESNPGCQGCGADVTDSQGPLWDLPVILHATVLENVTHVLSCCAQESDSIESGLVGVGDQLEHGAGGGQGNMQGCRGCWRSM